jgi:hypothetical protein
MEQDPDQVESKLKNRARPVKKLLAPTKPAEAPTSTPLPAVTEAPTPEPTAPPVVVVKTEPETPEPALKESSVSSIWWIILALLLAGGGWYYWHKRQEKRLMSIPTRPSPPLGGLSPVSGFFANGKRKSAARPGRKRR